MATRAARVWHKGKTNRVVTISTIQGAHYLTLAYMKSGMEFQQAVSHFGKRLAYSSMMTGGRYKTFGPISGLEVKEKVAKFKKSAEKAGFADSGVIPL